MSTLLSNLLEALDGVTQRALIDACDPHAIEEDFLGGLKSAAADLLRSDVQKSLALAELMLYAADRTGQSVLRGLGLISVANAYSLGGLGRDAEALALYDEAAAIYRKAQRPVDEANAQIAKILALMNLGRYDDALAAGRWAAPVLQAHGEWLRLGKLTANLGNLHFRRGEEVQALAMFDRARDTYARLPDDPSALAALGRLEHNRSAVLRDLGRFGEAITTSERALDILARTGQAAEVARCQQNLAITYFILGRYNDALTLLDQSRSFFLKDGRQRDAILVGLFTGHCLLQLRRFDEVLSLAQEAADLFARSGARFYVAQARLDEATAYAGLGRYDEALVVLAEARGLFGAEGNAMWVALTDLESASVLDRLGQHDVSLTLALSCCDAFWTGDLPVEQAQANLVAARAAIALGRDSEAERLVAAAQRLGEANDLPSLLYLCHHLLGMLAERQGELAAALAHVEQAMDELERLRRQLMIEHRAEFLEDKAVVYEDAVHLALELVRPTQAFAYAERARSRALVEMLDYRLQIGIQARTRADVPMVEELLRLRGERDGLYRRWIGHREVAVHGWTSPAGDQREVQAQVLAIERRITDLWRKLLIRNADYTRDAALWHTLPQPPQPDLPAGALLLEYFVAEGVLVAFVVHGEDVRAIPLTASPGEVGHLLGLLGVNLRTVAAQPLVLADRLYSNAVGLLRTLYAKLIAPIEALPGHPLQHAEQLIVVPCGALHYLPFQALYDGARFLADRCQVSYLPSASLLPHLTHGTSRAARPFVLGLSGGGVLPHAVEEAMQVAALVNGDVFVEERATVEALRTVGRHASLVHLATHAEFRPDNPLFSGLALADAWLTTLDIFGLELDASLVTLSGCHTGRSVVGGGEELLGLTRAFLAAGAPSLLISLWAVEDHSTADFMRLFYGHLVEGETKTAALQHAQHAFIGGEAYRHPYFWAPFALVGDTGRL